MAKTAIFILLIFSFNLATGYAQDRVNENQERTFYYDENTGRFYEVPETQEGIDSLLTISWENRNNNLRKGLQAAQFALALAESLKYEAGIARAHYLQGLSLMRLGAHAQALDHYLTAIDRETKRNDKERIGKVLTGISILYLHQENYEQATTYFKKAVRQFEETGNDERRAVVIMNLGIVYYRQQRYAKALEYFERAWGIFESLPDKEFMRMIAFTNIGNTWVEMGEYKKGERYLLQAIDYFDRKDLARNQSGAYIYLGKLYRRSGKPQQAMDYTRRGLQKALSINNKQYIIDGYEQLAGLYEDLNNYRTAYNLYKQFKAVQDSMLNSERLSAINEMQTRFDVKQKNQKIELLNKKAALKEAQLGRQKLWQNFLIVGLALLVVIAGLLYRYNNQKKRANVLLEQKNNEIEQKNEQLVQLNEEKDEFLGMAAHDLRNPLSGIKGAVSLLEGEQEVTKEQFQQYIEIIGISADRMLNLINNLLDTNAIEEGINRLEIVPVDIRVPIRKVVNNFEKIAREKEIRLVTLVDPHSKPVMVDNDAIMRILDNLISNAIKFSPTGVKVEVAARMQENRMALSVKDYGPGIPEEEQHKLFKRFSRLSTKPTGDEGSTGLGLFIVKKLVETMGGSVHCESQPDKGSEFIILLPVVANEEVLV